MHNPEVKQVCPAELEIHLQLCGLFAIRHSSSCFHVLLVFCGMTLRQVCCYVKYARAILVPCIFSQAVRCILTTLKILQGKWVV